MKLIRKNSGSKKVMKIETKWDWRVDFMLRTAGWVYVVWDEENIRDKKNRIRKHLKDKVTKRIGRR
jgi:hypothetical protein